MKNFQLSPFIQLSYARGDALVQAATRKVKNTVENGTARYIEVKSAKLGKEIPTFPKGEFEFAKSKSIDYHLYRMFNLMDRPRMFTANGDFDSFCHKELLQFKEHLMPAFDLTSSRANVVCLITALFYFFLFLNEKKLSI